MLRLDAQLWGRLADVAERSGRTPRQEIEARLRDSLGDARSGSAQTASEWSRAIARLIAVLAQDVASDSQSADEALAVLEVAAPALLRALLFGFKDALGKELHSVSESDKAAIVANADRLAKLVRQAHEPPQDPQPNTIEDKWAQLAGQWEARFRPPLDSAELQELQQRLLLTPEALAKMKKGVTHAKKN